MVKQNKIVKIFEEFIYLYKYVIIKNLMYD